MKTLVLNPQPTNIQVSRLSRKLQEFYLRPDRYTAFEETTDQSFWFRLIRSYAQKLVNQKRNVKILEIGAGHSTFGNYIRDIRANVQYHTQDITKSNLEHLKKMSDKVIIDDVMKLSGSYDLIFHTFVLEHISFPSSFLHKVNSLLNFGGYHIIICPRYDFPGYLSPSFRRNTRIIRFFAQIYLGILRLKTIACSEPSFVINCRPAVFQGPWYRDADAVHLVSGFDVIKWHSRNAFTVHRMELNASSLWDFIYKRFLILCISCKKGNIRS